MNNITKDEVETYLIRGDLAKITTYLNAGLDVNKVFVEGRTDIILESMIHNNIFLFNRVIEKGFNLSNNRFLYLHHAVRTGRFEFVEKLMKEYKKQQKEIDELDEDGNNLLHIYFLENIYEVNILEYLIKHNISVISLNSGSTTPLHLAIRRNVYLEDCLLDFIDLNKSVLDVKDGLGISVRDICTSYAKNEVWSGYFNNQKLIKIMGQ